MAGFTQFEAVEPVVIPPTEEVVYDKYWLETMVVRAPSPSQDAKLSARFRLYNDVTREYAPNSDFISIEIPHLFTRASQDMNVATAMEGVFRALKIELDNKLNPTTTTTTTEGTVEETTTTTTEEVTTTTTTEEVTTTTTTEEVTTTTTTEEVTTTTTTEG